MEKAAHRNRLDQQATEKAHVEHFLRLKGITASVEYGDAPDAVLVAAGRRIGLEHRELTEELLAANRRNIDELPRLVRESLRQKASCLEFSIGLSVGADAVIFRRRTDVQNLAERLARFIAEHERSVTREAPIDLNISELKKLGFAALIALHVTRFPSLRGGPDVFVSAGFWGPGESSAIEAVREKERRLATYKASANLDAVWLLLVTGEEWVQATDSVLTEELTISTSFDEVYLLDTRAGAVQRLDDHDRSD